MSNLKGECDFAKPLEKRINIVRPPGDSVDFRESQNRVPFGSLIIKIFAFIYFSVSTYGSPATTRGDLTMPKWCYIRENWQTAASSLLSSSSPCVASTCSTPSMRLLAEQSFLFWLLFFPHLHFIQFGCFGVLMPSVQWKWLGFVGKLQKLRFLECIYRRLCADATQIIYFSIWRWSFGRRRYALDMLVDFTRHDVPTWNANGLWRKRMFIFNRPGVFSVRQKPNVE